MPKYSYLISMLMLSEYAHLLESTKASSDCDFLRELETPLLEADGYYQNSSYAFVQYQACLNDSSLEAQTLQHEHDGKVAYQLEMSNEYPLTIAVFGGSSMQPCDKDWKDAVEMGYHFEKKGYRVLQGGGAGLMMALRVGSDLFCQTPEAIEQVTGLMCEAKTATEERQKEIKFRIKKEYTSCHPQHMISLHGAQWLRRMPSEPEIGHGALRAEVFNKFLILKIMAETPDVWIAAPGSSGTVIEVDAAFQELDYHYLKPEKNQNLIFFNPKAWESKKQIHADRLNRQDVYRADNPKEILNITDSIVEKKVCRL